MTEFHDYYPPGIDAPQIIHTPFMDYVKGEPKIEIVPIVTDELIVDIAVIQPEAESPQVKTDEAPIVEVLIAEEVVPEVPAPVVEDVPTTDDGKIDYEALRESILNETDPERIPKKAKKSKQ